MDTPAARRVEQIRSAVDVYQSQLIAFEARITGDAESARDVVQETFLRLCRRDLEKKEISAVTSQSVSSVGFLIHVAIKRLRSILRVNTDESQPSGSGGRSHA